MNAEWLIGNKVHLSKDGLFVFEHYGAVFKSTGRIAWSWRNAIGKVVGLFPRGGLLAVEFHWGVEVLNESFLEAVHDDI